MSLQPPLFYSASLNELLESKVDEDPAGAHGADISSPRTVGIVVWDQLIVHGKDPTDRRCELKIKEVKVNSKTNFPELGRRFHSKFSSGIILWIVTVAR